MCADYVPLHSISPNQTVEMMWVLVLGCVLVELSSSVTPASVCIAARGLPSKAVSHCGSQPHCSCHGKQAPGPLVLRSYCCKALGAQNTDDAQMLPATAGAVKPLQSKPELTVQPSQICGCSLCTAALLPHFSPSPPPLLLHSPAPPLA